MALDQYDKDEKLSKEGIRDFIDSQIRRAVRETFQEIMESEMNAHLGAEKSERGEERLGYRNGYRDRTLETRIGAIDLSVPRDRDGLFETNIFERYRRAEVSLEEAMLEMYLSGISTRKVADVTDALCGLRKSSSAQSDLNKRLYDKLKAWRERPLKDRHPYLYLDGLVISMRLGDEVENVSLLVAVSVNERGYREVLGVMEGCREDKASWTAFLRALKKRGLTGVRLIVADRHLGLVGAARECFPKSRYQRCKVHFMRNIFSKTPRKEAGAIALMLRAIFSQESREAALEKAKEVAATLRTRRLVKAAEILEGGIEEATTFYQFPAEHWRRIASNNPIERLNREIRRRTNVVGSFPDIDSALMLVSARLRYIDNSWTNRRYMNMDLLSEMELEEEPVEAG